MRALVTGCAGFIGSHVSEALIANGWNVLGIDRLSSFYDRDTKLANLDALVASPQFSYVESDVSFMDIANILGDVDVVFHLAAQPGVRASWGSEFAVYVEDNIRATQHLLEACRVSGVQRFVFASSSSVYGNIDTFPTREDYPTKPHSPYGVTKLAAENLAVLYANNWHIPTVALRFFTVYGPRQRPDMALARLISCCRSGEPFRLFGDGSAVRDLTYVGDVVRACLAAAESDVAPGTVLNIGGGDGHSMSDVMAIVERVVGRELNVTQLPGAPGDVPRTGADIALAGAVLGWKPEVLLANGIEHQADWQLRTAASR